MGNTSAGLLHQLCFLFVFETESYSVTQAGVQMLSLCNLCLLGSSHSCASASQVAGIDYRQAPPNLTNFFVFLVDMQFCHVGQADLQLLASSDLPTSASQSTGITGASHHSWPPGTFLYWRFFGVWAEPCIGSEKMRGWLTVTPSLACKRTWTRCVTSLQC